MARKTNTVKITKKQQIIDFVNDYFLQEPNMVFTLRQLYYRLVAKQVIKNSIGEYKYVSEALTDARYRRIEGNHDRTTINWERIEDRGRTVIGSKISYMSIKEEIEYFIGSIRYADIYLSRMLYQPNVTVILLEKEALEGIFEPICKALNAYLLVGKGYSSFTALAVLGKLLQSENRNIHLKIFSDYDGSGLDIQRYMRDTLKDKHNIEFASIERIALNLEQIEKYNLPHDVLKKSDPRTKNTEAKFAVELDALDPALLRELITNCILCSYDNVLYNEVEHLSKAINKRFKKLLLKAIKKELESL